MVDSALSRRRRWRVAETGADSPRMGALHPGRHDVRRPRCIAHERGLTQYLTNTANKWSPASIWRAHSTSEPSSEPHRARTIEDAGAHSSQFGTFVLARRRLVGEPVTQDGDVVERAPAIDRRLAAPYVPSRRADIYAGRAGLLWPTIARIFVSLDRASLTTTASVYRLRGAHGAELPD